MQCRGLSIVAAVACFAIAPSAQAAAIGKLANEIFNSNGAAAGTNSEYDSSITVPTNDLIFGQMPISTNYVGNYNANGGNLGVLTDGQTATDNFGSASLDPNQSSYPSNCAFDLGTNWYAEYDLGAATAIGSILVTTGHTDTRVNQDYDILVSTDGVNFTSLSDGSTQVLGSPGTGFAYNPSGGSGGAAQSTVVDADGSSTLAVARYVEFVEDSGGSDIYRELDVLPVPEPASLGLLGIGVMAILGRRRRLA